MAVSMRNLDQAFQGAGQKAGVEVWRIENSRPVLVPKSSHGKFFMGDSYIVLETSSLKNGTLRHDIHYWLGKDTTQDEAGTAAIKTVELDAALGGRAVQYREVQGYETEKFLSYFKPCIIPQEGGVSSGFKHAKAEAHRTRLYVCKGKRVVHVKEVPFARSSLNHDSIFILDTKSKIFQFNGSNSSIQERAKALEVVQFIKDTYHDGKCEIAAVEDGRMMADAETGEFWSLFGGFAPLPRKVAGGGDKMVGSHPTKLLCVKKGDPEPVEADSLTRALLASNKCYILDSGTEVFIWMGRNTSIEERKNSSRAAEELVSGPDRPQSHIMRVTEGFEPIVFQAKFDSWPRAAAVAVSEDGRGKVAALLKRQGFNVKGLLKAEPVREEPRPYIDCTGNLQVWRVSGQEKLLLPVSDQSKFYSGDCYIFQYSYSGEDKEEYLVGTWFGKQSVEGERASALSLASQMVEALKFLPVQACIYEGYEPVQFYSIFQRFIVFKGGLSDGYKNYIAENGISDVTNSRNSIALFRVQGSGPENMQAIQVEAVGSSLNSSYCYILYRGSTVFTWFGSLTTTDHQELVERFLDMIKPNCQSKPHKEGAESELFWGLLGGKTEYPSQKIAMVVESDPHLFSCTYSKEILKVDEIYNFGQDDLMAEDIDILSCHSQIFVWVGQQVDPKTKLHALKIGEKFLEIDFFHEKLSRETPIYIVMEGSEPPFFTRFFSWDSAKSDMHGNSFQRKLALVKNDGAAAINKPKRRAPVMYGGRSSSVPEKAQRSRSVSFSPDRVRVRGRSPAFNALAANFENPSARNLSTPPPMVRRLYPKSVTTESSRLASKNAAIAALSASFEQPPPAREAIIPRSFKGTLGVSKPIPELDKKETSMSNRIESLTIVEDAKEGEVEDEEGLTIHPYESLTTTSSSPASDIDVTKRETYLSMTEFKEKFGMTKDAFYKLPKWKQNKLKMALHLF
ncbi:villin-4-like isoform X1 [Cucurbita pepo subsp. pepo]|uniref:villin-4-like isoform X1 n=1 Tax=Cucurbita pepo subsp. pepo TaxID=3664 RepID=UPI000C9D4F65|nr:villin-4-like isoform X1 [Cucurbita pepo subsp. pepo]XP_023516797.1 villin-4-like isoform X1 [Cucurbita pepo subsp. pepo]XP_023516798.1 villin-4-like isoform X1 [Cucurbita pepo subsp. pepo]XP_023516799.1 villin-4-like isoform X1 [Cucurbita pepo subsp. pepo]XP_023516800.1 villin-4-like isoform X1 [Cucurbita pepo subsp. pepo]